jgi:hypothetical protein
MKTYKGIVIFILLGAIILYTWITCTDFNAMEAAVIGGVEVPEPTPGGSLDGPIILYLDHYGTMFKSYMDYPEIYRSEIFYPGNSQSPTSMSIDEVNKYVYWSFRNFNGDYEIHKAKYDIDGFFTPESLFFSTNEINCVIYIPGSEMLIYSEGTDIMEAYPDGSSTWVLWGGHLSTITDMVFNPSSGNERIYFADDTLYYYEVTYNNPIAENSYETIPGSPTIKKMAYDISRNELYYISDDLTYTDEIYTLPVYQSEPSSFVTNPECYLVKDLLVDPMGEFVFWTDDGDASNQYQFFGIVSVSIINGQRVELVEFDEDTSGYAFAIDYTGITVK